MFTKKDREIANLKAKVANRNVAIKKHEEKIAELESKLSQIRTIASSNNCGNPELYLRKIIELADRKSN